MSHVNFAMSIGHQGQGSSGVPERLGAGTATPSGCSLSLDYLLYALSLCQFVVFVFLTHMVENKVTDGP